VPEPPVQVLRAFLKNQGQASYVANT
jgi:hypothetical protein